MKEVKRYKAARMNLIVMLAFTLCNVGLGLYGSDRYYLFSNTLSYVFARYGRAYYEALGDKIDLLVGGGLAVLVLVPYLLCWIFSKKRRGWMIAALVLFSLDTIFMLVEYLPFFEPSLLLDIAFHIWVLVYLVLGVISGPRALEQEDNPDYKPRHLAGQENRFYDASQQPTGQPDTLPIGTPAEGKSRVLVSATYGTHEIEARRSYGLTELVVDGWVYARQEGVMESAYTISAQVDGHTVATSMSALGSQTIEVDGEVIAKKQRLY